MVEQLKKILENLPDDEYMIVKMMVMPDEVPERITRVLDLIAALPEEEVAILFSVEGTDGTELQPGAIEVTA